jgi:hypothetical protein
MPNHDGIESAMKWIFVFVLAMIFCNSCLARWVGPR